VQTLLAKEGSARGAKDRAGSAMVPCVILRINPNAYDGPRTSLKRRVVELADWINTYVQMGDEAISLLQTHAPIVHVFYYHSKDGAANLAHLAGVAAAVGWEYTVH